MTQRDQLFEISTKLDKFSDSLKENQKILTEHGDMLGKVIRGIYGDEENQVKGLLARQKDDEDRWVKLSPVMEHVDKIPKLITFYSLVTDKRVWGGVITAVTIIWAIATKWGSIEKAISVI